MLHNGVDDEDELELFDVSEYEKAGTSMRGLALITQVGFSISSCLFTGVMLGKYLDRWFGTNPLMLILCSMLGTAAALRAVFHFVTRS